jgi:hypothetical protein
MTTSPFSSWFGLTEYAKDLMSGSNSDMQIVSSVDSGADGTDASLTPYTWTCPDVTPYSNIYFYQVRWISPGMIQFLTSQLVFQRSGQEFQMDNAVYGMIFSDWPAQISLKYDVQIASPSGSTTVADNPTQPNGDPIPWGNGHLSSSIIDDSEHQTASQRNQDFDPVGNNEVTSSEPSSTSTRMKQSSQASVAPSDSISKPTSSLPSMKTKAPAPTTPNAKPTSMPCPGMNSMGMMVNDAKKGGSYVGSYFIISLFATLSMLIL